MREDPCGSQASLLFKLPLEILEVPAGVSNHRRNPVLFSWPQGEHPTSGYFGLCRSVHPVPALANVPHFRKTVRGGLAHGQAGWAGRPMALSSQAPGPRRSPPPELSQY